ncbi:hypothetical protein P2G88_03800 [Aliiglaciecola sp. CAU 1673]|uniref:hypothetical protein n=1 Tax=Aliiglaciecola sp. CAU 1673 TaxID=3032595 RepID=UPI0023DA419A|nr:hypothetical protein [Aliiglaciecola sp. CAU 1673]MDF2177368.1 hypothetical protein [Aliiglaciecola sp. CAU 1673]
MKIRRALVTVLASWMSLSASAFEISEWTGVWERYSAEGQVEERITAKEVIEGKLLSSKIEYFKDGKPVGDGATVMSDLQGKVRASMHFTNGLQIELDTLAREEDSVFFQLRQINLATGEQVAEMFTRFTLLTVDGKQVLRQDVYKDKEQNTALVSVDFYKKAV